MRISRQGPSLGLHSAITRRDFIGATLVGSGALLLGAPAPSAAQELTTDWNGYQGIGDYARSNGNIASVVNAAHGVRDGLYEAAIPGAPVVDELYDLIIVGGGFAGLIAAYEFRKARPNGRCLILENHPVFGGEAKQNQMQVDGVMLTGPQGSNDAIVPRADNTYAHVADLWDEIGMPRSYDFVAPERGGLAEVRARQLRSDVLERGRGVARLLLRYSRSPRSGRGWSTRGRTTSRRAPIPADARHDWLPGRSMHPVLTRGDEAVDGSLARLYVLWRSHRPRARTVREVFRLSDPLVATGDYGVSSDAVSAYGAKLLGLPGTGGTSPAYRTSRSRSRAAMRQSCVTSSRPDPEAITGSRSFADVLFAPIDFAALDRPQSTRIRLGATASQCGTRDLRRHPRA